MTLQEWMNLRPNDLFDLGPLPWKGKVGKMLPTVASVHIDKPLDEEDEKKKKQKLDLEKDLIMELITKQAVSPGKVVKMDEDQHIAYAWASVSTLNGQPYHDEQGDNISDAEMEKMSADFVTEVRKAGEMHRRTDNIGTLVASMPFTAEVQKALGIQLCTPTGEPFTGWLTGWKVTDMDVWKKIKSGEYGALSIHGKGNREEL